MLIEITDEKSEEIFNDILFDFIFAKTTQIKPLGIILGGQPRAGKSYLVKEVEDEFQKDFIFISTDDLRLYHPAYATLQQNPETLQNAANLVNPYASAWTERLIKHCIENKFNLIIDSTLGGNINAVYYTVDMLRENDFSIHLRLMAVPAFISKLSIFLRYESQLKEKGFARWTRMEDHNDRFEKIPNVAEQIFATKPPDTARFYQRVLSEKSTISLKSSQVFFLDNNAFPTFAFLKEFNSFRNHLEENHLAFISHAIKTVQHLIKLRNGSLAEFKTTIIQESEKLPSKLKKKILKTITNI
jgi:predicted ABC-type ATPase